MPRYSPYGNYLARSWPLASLTLLLLALALGVAVAASVRAHVLELFLVAFAIPAGFAALIAANGYGILSSHDGRFRLRQLLAVSGAFVGLAGVYVSFSLARDFENDALAYFVARLLPYAAVVCLIGLGIIRLSTRLRHSARPGDAVAAGGAVLAALSVVTSLWLGFQNSEEQLLIAMIVGLPSLGLGIVVITYALKQSGRSVAVRAMGVFGSLAIAAMAIYASAWFATTAEKDYVYVAVSTGLIPMSIAALNWRIAYQLSPWPIWASAALIVLSLGIGLWAAIGQGDLVEIFLFPIPDTVRIVNSFGWTWLAKALPSLAISLYAIFCIEEPWQWYWEWLRARRGARYR